MNKHTATLLEQHFDTAFNAPDGLKKLRELILTLAMQGKLVPQDPSAPPASELLKEIEAEKKRLVKEGKIKAPKPLPPVTEEEKPYALPQGWEWVRLGELFSIVYGKGLPTSNLTNEGYDVFGANGIIGKYSKFLYEPPQLLVSCRGAYSGKPNISPPFCFVTSNSLVLENTWEYLCLEFFFFAIEIAEKTKIVTGSAQPQVTTTNLEPFLVPLPPLPEQHRIVAKIDELMARCDALEKLRTAQNEKRLSVHAAAIQQLLNIGEPAQHQRAQAFLAEHFGDLYTVKENVAELRKAILQLAVMGKLVPQNPNDPPASALLKEIEAEKKRLVKEGKIKTPKLLPPVTEEEKPYGLPQGWEWVRLGEIVLSSDSGWSPQCNSESRTGKQWGIVKVSAVSWGTFNPNENKALPQSQQPRPECEIGNGDFLISRANTDELVARSVVVEKTPPHLMMSDKIVRLNLSSHVNKIFINHIKATLNK